MISVFDPQGLVAEVPRIPPAPVPRAGRVKIGLLDNGKPNAGMLLAAIGERIVAWRPDAEIVTVSKFGDGDGAAAMRPVVPEKLAWLVRECDVVLTGSGD